LSRVGRSSLLPVGVFLLTLALVLAGCGGGGEQGQKEDKKEQEKKEKGEAKSGAQDQISIEGSSTVLPITQAAAEGFNRQNPNVQITVGGAGTGDGIEAFCNGDIPIADASRAIKPEEAETCQENGVEFVELPVAWDGVTVVVNPQNNFADDVTTDQLRTLFEPSAEGEITTWNQVNPEWPEQRLTLYGPGTESGTFEFFTEKVVGRAKDQRTDYQASEDDNVLVQGVTGDPNALGYFGFGYFEENQNRLKALTIDGVAPSADTINSGEYPLSRPLFIYVTTQALEDNPAVQGFVQFYLSEGNLENFVQQAQYVPLSAEATAEARERFQDRNAGSSPETIGGEKVGGKGKEKTG
jgi:phosphate transport system substrate-binding protein